MDQTRTLIEIFANEKRVVEGLVAKSAVDKKVEVDSLLVKLLGTEDLQQASYLDASLFFHLSNSDIGFKALSRSCIKA